jgi:leucyl aminopeptidase
MDIRVSTRDVQQFDGDAVVVGVFSDDEGLQGPAAVLDDAMAGVLAGLRAAGEITGVVDECVIMHTLGKIEPLRVAVVGFGKREKFTTDRLRRSAAIACRKLRRAGAKRVGLALAGAESGINLAVAARAVAESALLGLYRFRRFKSEPWADANLTDDAATNEIESLTILGRGREPALRAAVERGQILAESANFARDLGNEPPNVLTPSELAERARRLADAVGLECEIFGPERIRELGMGALLAVTSGSAQEPRFIILRHRGGQAGELGPAFVGKGITFDSGGLSLKTNDGMLTMKMDMCGAAAVLGAMRAIALLKPPLNVTGIVPTCENMPSATAFRVGDVLRAMNGKTIEIVNTDAEGRLILADALSYATAEGHTPIVDAATLTGSIAAAIGPYRAGLFSNDEPLQRTIQTAAEVAGEKLWPMPMDADYEKLIYSEIADVKQTGGRNAGSITAAKVLARFVGDTPWAHLDIASVYTREKREADGAAGATGFGVRTFVEIATLLAERNGNSRGRD